MSTSEEGSRALGEKVMEDKDCTRMSSESLSGGEVDLQGKDHCQSLTFQLQNSEIIEDLKLGMEFSSADSAYNYYVLYGEKHGFDVRKQHRKVNKKGFITRYTYVCSKEGHRRNRKEGEGPSYSLPISRVGCEAHMTCQLQKNGKFTIVSFNANHNHDLIGAPMKHLLRINRRMLRARKTHGDDVGKSRIPINATGELMSSEVRGRENIGFVNQDCPNYIHKKRERKMEKGDAGAILKYFQKMRANNFYFYSIQLDEDDMLTNIFWADARSISDYSLFGDVICFDTTYRINEYGRPFAPFIGVNHHKQTVVFGAALLYDETTDSFKWLFETFLAAMSGKQPKTILTGQSAAMAKAISEVFSAADHRLCAWHIYQSAAKNLSPMFHGSKQFSYDLSKCLYGVEDEDEWLFAWNDMLEKYDLKENKWLEEMFEVRKKWALVYGRHTFTADIMSTLHSESMNNVLKKYLMPSLDLLGFFEHYERVVADRRDDELIADFKMMQTKPLLLTNVEMLRHAVEVYTPEVFKLFEKEYMAILDCSIYKVGKSGMTRDYKVSYSHRSQEHLVEFDASKQTVTCSCMKFTFVGILCSHALKVLDKKNVKRIPPNYILKRWTRDAKARSITNYHGIETNNNPKESIGKRYSHLCCNFHEIASFAAEHEKLTTYAHEHSIELLKSLEEMKKKLCLDNTCAGQNLEGEALLGGSGESEPVKMINLNNCEITKACGVKRKATAEHPCSRLEDPFERQEHIPQIKATQAPTTRQWLSMQDNMPFTQQHHIDNGTQVPFSSINFGATTNFQDSMPFTPLFQEASMHCNGLSQSTGDKELGN